MSYEKPQPPEKEFSAVGICVVISAAVWRNEIERDGRMIVRFSVRLKKRYYDRDTQSWQDANSFFPEDLPKVRLVVEQAYAYVTLRERDPEAEAACPAEAS